MTTDAFAHIEALCRRYVDAIDRDDAEAVLAEFTDDAIVTSPVYGARPVRAYFRHLLAITSGQSMALKAVFIDTRDPARVAMHVDYTRTVKGSVPTTSEAVDLFTLDEDRSKFAAVTIIYDTEPVRAAFDRADSGHS